MGSGVEALIKVGGRGVRGAKLLPKIIGWGVETPFNIVFIRNFHNSNFFSPYILFFTLIQFSKHFEKKNKASKFISSQSKTVQPSNFFFRWSLKYFFSNLSFFDSNDFKTLYKFWNFLVSFEKGKRGEEENIFNSKDFNTNCIYYSVNYVNYS